jgi:hypothetical protein
VRVFIVTEGYGAAFAGTTRHERVDRLGSAAMHSRTRTRRSHRAAALAASLGFVLAACGGDAEPDTAVQPAPATAAPATAGQATAPSGGAVTSAPAAPGTTAAAPEPAPSSAGGAATTAAPAEAPEALRFTAPLVGGGTIDAASLAGTPVLFWFWAPY